MPKRSRKPPKKDFNQLARKVVDQATGVTPKKPAKPPRPVNKKDAADLDRADSEGMGQPQGTPPRKRPKKKPADKRDPAAVALGEGRPKGRQGQSQETDS